MELPADVAAAVAANTRALRGARGWSLEQLAHRAGVSKGMLVQLEGARTNPSLGTLCRVAEAYGVTIAALVEQPSSAAVRVVPPDGGTVLWTGPGGGAGRLLLGVDEREHVELWTWTLAPGEVHESAPGHAAGTVELVAVEQGELTLEVGGADHVVGAGGALAFRAAPAHAYRNARKRPCRFTMVVLQPEGDLAEWAGGAPSGPA